MNCSKYDVLYIAEIWTGCIIPGVPGWNASGWSDLKSDLTKALALTLDVSLRDISDNNQLSPFFAVSTSKDDKVNVSIFKVSSTCSV